MHFGYSFYSCVGLRLVNWFSLLIHGQNQQFLCLQSVVLILKLCNTLKQLLTHRYLVGRSYSPALSRNNNIFIFYHLLFGRDLNYKTSLPLDGVYGVWLCLWWIQNFSTGCAETNEFCKFCNLFRLGMYYEPDYEPEQKKKSLRFKEDKRELFFCSL